MVVPGHQNKGQSESLMQPLECSLLKTRVTGGCYTYHIEYIWHQILNKNLYSQKSNGANLPGTVTSHDIPPCQRILQGTVKDQQRKGTLRKSCMENIKKWIGCSFPTLLQPAEDRELWRSLTVQASTMTPIQPSRPGVSNLFQPRDPLIW